MKSTAVFDLCDVYEGNNVAVETSKYSEIAMFVKCASSFHIQHSDDGVNWTNTYDWVVKYLTDNWVKYAYIGTKRFVRLDFGTVAFDFGIILGCGIIDTELET